MALKFRRGTTAQQSGSLAFGEPYVNTTLGTLVIGGANGDIVLSSAGTGSTGTFGAISGSGLDITGNASIAGNLTLGGNITIGDATSDNLVVNADLSSSIIPNDDSAFDLGSSSKKYRKVYATSIEATNITASAQIVNGDLKISSASPRIYLIDTDSNSDFSIINSDGTYTIYDDSTSTGRFKIYTNGLTEINGPLSVLGGISGSIAATNGVVSGSSQVIGILSSLNTYTGSNDTTNTSQNTRLTALEASASTALSTNNSQGVSVTNLNTFSSSALTRLTALEVDTTNLETFTSSINTTIKSKLNVEAVISSSAQVTLSSTTGFTAYSTSVDSRISTEKGRVDAILSAAAADKDSFAEIVTLINSVDTTNDTAFASFYTASVGRLNNLESTSASVNTSVSNVNSFTSSINSTIKTKLDSETVVSGSSQVIGILSSLNSYTASNDTTNTTQNTRLTGLEASASTALSTNTTQTDRLNQLSTASGSALTRLSALEVETSNLESFTSSINTTIKTKLNTDGVISGSSQINVASTTGDIALGTRTSGNYVASLVAGTNITLANNTGEGATPTIGLTNNSITIAGTATSLGGAITADQIRTAIGTVVTGSSQINLASVTGNTTSNVSEGTNLYYTDARVKTKLNAEAVISSSAQVALSSTTGFTTFSSSVDSRIATEKGRVDAILSAADANADTFAEIVSLINSVDTTNDNAFASFYTASNATNDAQSARLSSIESATGSYETKGRGIVSGSSQISLGSVSGNSTSNVTEGTNLYYTDARVKTKLTAEGVISGSSQVIGILSSLNSYTASNDTTNTTQTSRLDQLSTASGSAITRLTALEVETANLEAFSSSALTRLSALEGKDISVTLTGDVTGTGTITDLGNVSFATTIAANSVALGTDTTGNYMSGVTAGTGISVSHTPGEGSTATITNSGVTSAVAGTGVTVSGATGAVTFSIGQAVATTSNVTFGSVTATGDVVAYSTSDKRHKNNIQTISNAVLKVKQLNGVTWEWNDDVNEVTKSTPKTGLIAQEVQQVLPQVVNERADGFLSLDYSKMVGLLVEAIKEQQIQIDQLKAQIGSK